MSTSPPSPAVAAAYRYCEIVTAQHARNFSYGIRLLPTPKRRALSALYAFSRRVDDIGDGLLRPATKEARLRRTRGLLRRLREDAVPEDATDPVAVALSHTTHHFPIPLDALDELVEGVLMDVRGRRYETWDELVRYCRCVAGAVGRLSLGVFGTLPAAPEARHAPAYADSLGLALQLTNILRDIREDAALGRTYLPARELRSFGCPTEIPQRAGAGLAVTGADFPGLVRFQVRRARALFDHGFRLLPLLDRRSAACAASMAGIYHQLLDRIDADPFLVLRGRVSLSTPRKALVAARTLVAGRTPAGPDTRRLCA
ncbi:presqualene diphosphate synthase HpnD [Streptomyces sp. 4N509B]|uniref:presqualene diphosphate synthase HpnD n=1 Tax=Streptomyces sp. 4N509B TaxID=3457413 RepID=UPI003FD5AC25